VSELTKNEEAAITAFNEATGHVAHNYGTRASIAVGRELIRLRARIAELEAETKRARDYSIHLDGLLRAEEARIAELERERDAFGAGLDKANHKRAVAESQLAAAREALSNVPHEDHCLADAVTIGPAGIRGIVKRGGDPDAFPQPCTCALAAVRAALDGLGEKKA
jgi:septal ring factor EnvC (AmiA/AmiB activator)